MSRSTAIIGAGVAGCAAAYRLSKSGRRVVLFERDSNIGGRTTTWRKDGLQVDSGAGFFTNFYPTLKGLMPALSLRDQVNVLSRHSVLVKDGVRGELVLGSLGSFVNFPLLSPAAKARMASATAWITLRYRGLDIASPKSLAKVDDLSIAEDARRRVGEEAYQIVVRSGIEPFWYFSCEEVSRALMLALQARAADAHFFTFQGGMDSVCRALANGLEVHTDTPVSRVAREGSDQFRVSHARGSEVFDEVVFATTATVAHKLSADLDGVVHPDMRAFVESQTYVPNAHATFVVDRSACPPQTSSMFPCGPSPKTVAALSFNSFKGQCGSALASDKELVCVFLTAEESKRLIGASDEQVYERCWALARAFCPELPAYAEPFRAIARDEAIPVHAVGRYKKAAALRDVAKGPIAFAGDYLATATVDGALRSGMRAAKQLLG